MSDRLQQIPDENLRMAKSRLMKLDYQSKTQMYRILKAIGVRTQYGSFKAQSFAQKKWNIEVLDNELMLLRFVSSRQLLALTEPYWVIGNLELLYLIRVEG
jgi:hypothetical protein